MSAIFAGALAILVWVGIINARIPLLKVVELRSMAAAGETVHVDDGRVLAIESYAPLRFTVTGESAPGAPLRVTSPRSAPENFKVGGAVSLWGTYDPAAGTFQAYRVATKCPSKYTAKTDPGRDR